MTIYQIPEHLQRNDLSPENLERLERWKEKRDALTVLPGSFFELDIEGVEIKSREWVPE